MTYIDPLDIAGSVLITLSFTLAVLRLTHYARQCAGLRGGMALSGVACLSAYGVIAAVCFWPHYPLTAAAGLLLILAGLRFVLVVARLERWATRVWLHLTRCPYEQRR